MKKLITRSHNDLIDFVSGELVLIGDIHGNWGKLKEIVNAHIAGTKFIVLGDMGIGFDRDVDDNIIEDPYFENVMFLRGNHDNPHICKSRDDYLGDYGVIDGIGFISGAWSIDRHCRIDGLDWWEDEELSYIELNAMIDYMVDKKPEIIISHATADRFKEELVFNSFPSRTEDAMQELFEKYQPKQWICGHYHTSLKLPIGNTEFICLDVNETYKLR